MEYNIDDKMRRAVDNAVLTVENRMHDTISTAMYKLVIPRVEAATRSITVATGHGPIGDVQNPDRRNFLWNTGNTPVMSACSRLGSNTNQNRNDVARNEENFEGCDFAAIRPILDRRAHAHHN